MRNFILTISLLFITTQFVTAQTPPRRDTAWGNFRNQVYYNSILRAPVVTGETQSINIIPNQGPFCFDKKIIIKSATGSLVAEQCVYMDTKGGLIGFVVPVSVTNSNACEIRPNHKEFSFSIIGLKGNIFTYRNEENNGDIQHWVSTGNTQNFQYQAPSSSGFYTLHNKHLNKVYCNGMIRATAYRYDNAASPTLYLFGKSFPESMKVMGKKYIGALGIGYQHTDKGLFIIMETLSDQYNSRIIEIEDVNICFDPNPFQILEDELARKRRDDLLKERARIDRNAASIRNDDACAGPRRNIIVFDRAQLRLQEQSLETMQQGNLYQNPAAQRASLNMSDPLFMVQGNILEVQLSICNTEESIRTSPSSDLTAELNCLQNLLGRLHGAEAQMSALDARYSDEPGRAYSEKSRIYSGVIAIRCN